MKLVGNLSLLLCTILGMLYLPKRPARITQCLSLLTCVSFHFSFLLSLFATPPTTIRHYCFYFSQKYQTMDEVSLSSVGQPVLKELVINFQSFDFFVLKKPSLFSVLKRVLAYFEYCRSQEKERLSQT